VLYQDYFNTREKRKEQYTHYFENVIMKKGERDMENDPPEFPSPEPSGAAR